MTELIVESYPSPREVGVDHDEWRSNQLIALKEIDKMEKKEYLFVEAPTGTGKSALPTAMGSKKKQVLVVVHTLALLDQYRENYKFNIIKGRQEYPCVLEKKVEAWKKTYKLEPTAANCHFTPMTECDVAEHCPYIIAKHTALASKRAGCTYRYLGVSMLMKLRKGHIIFDEAHDSAEELIRFSKFEVMDKTLNKYNLPPFPLTTYGFENEGAELTDESIEQIGVWLSTCIRTLKLPKDKIEKAPPGHLTSRTRFKRMKENLNKNWFLQIYNDRFLLQSLSANDVAQEIFKHKDKKVLMSATIGNPQPLATSLGIKEYKTLSLPHPTPPKYRSVKKLNVPSLSARNLQQNPALYGIQARAVWEWIQNHPDNFRGVILTTSFKKISELEKVIAPLAKSKNRRLIVQERGNKVGLLINQFITDVQEGDIALGTIQGWGTGIDLKNNLARWLIVAGVPHVNPTDAYMKARRKLDGGQTYQKWLVYNAVMQACGRISRGEKDYQGFWLYNYAALADGSAMTKTAIKYYGDWFNDAIR